MTKITPTVCQVSRAVSGIFPEVTAIQKPHGTRPKHLTRDGILGSPNTCGVAGRHHSPFSSTNYGLEHSEPIHVLVVRVDYVPLFKVALYRLESSSAHFEFQARVRP